MVYIPSMFSNHFLKNDTILISYKGEITIQNKDATFYMDKYFSYNYCVHVIEILKMRFELTKICVNSIFYCPKICANLIFNYLKICINSVFDNPKLCILLDMAGMLWYNKRRKTCVRKSLGFVLPCSRTAALLTASSKCSCEQAF